MLSHFGQATISPIAATSRTANLAWQVVQVIEKRILSTIDARPPRFSPRQ
jgi:hypothetical protein